MVVRDVQAPVTPDHEVHGPSYHAVIVAPAAREIFDGAGVPAAEADTGDLVAGGGAPPDYVTEVRQGAAYGWPRCFAERHVFLRDRTITSTRGCEGMTLPTRELMPHAAPLGLVFYTGAQFPSEYRDNLLVALHGSRAGLPAAG